MPLCRLESNPNQCAWPYKAVRQRFAGGSPSQFDVIVVTAVLRLTFIDFANIQAASGYSLQSRKRKIMLAPTICKSCASTNQINLQAEMNIHLPWTGMRSLDQPSLFAFPKLTVCLDCGHTESKLSEVELTQIRESTLGVVRISLA